MAWADYKICDCCGDRKVFYDADIQDERYRATFGEKSDYDPIGLKAICGDCNKTHKVVIVPRGAAAPTFTAADLEMAWGMGRDEAARAVHEAGRMTLGHLNAIGGLTPPADLAQRVKGPAHD